MYNGFRSQEQYQRVFDAIIDAIDYNAVSYVAVNYDADSGLIEVDYDNVVVSLTEEGVENWYSNDELEQFDIYTLECLNEAVGDIFEAFEEEEGYEYDYEAERY